MKEFSRNQSEVKTLLAIPMYNCEKQITRVLQGLTSYRSYFDAVLIIDNRSNDQSIEKAAEFVKRSGFADTTIIKNSQNYSLGGSLKISFKWALEEQFTHLIILHGDDQADFKDLMSLMDKRIHLQYDCLLGARFLPSSQLVGYSLFRTFGNKLLNLFCSVCCHTSIYDMGSGVNMYKVSFLKDKRWLFFPDDLTFNISLLFHTYRRQYSALFFPIKWREEDQVSNARVFKQMLNIMKLAIRLNASDEYLYPVKNSKVYSYETQYKT